MPQASAVQSLMIIHDAGHKTNIEMRKKRGSTPSWELRPNRLPFRLSPVDQHNYTTKIRDGKKSRIFLFPLTITAIFATVKPAVSLRFSDPWIVCLSVISSTLSHASTFACFGIPDINQRIGWRTERLRSASSSFI